MTFPLDAKSIFGEALEILAPAERAAYLDAACAGNANLRAEVEALLASLEKAGGFMGRPAAAVLTPEIGSRVGPYTLEQPLGEGGMGVVYRARQEEPVRRQVAVKLIKGGADSARVVARFEQERQALALMDHPNIARVLEAGETESGQPYVVMELVEGEPITTYCDRKRLPPRDRLELFIPVCRAVQHAHQKGIIHRDLKPSNVLVATYDGRPVPKVIDFGVAKAVNRALSERTQFTEAGLLVGTLEYMAPEQAEASNLDVDTRADVYSLGVILYELLTGSPPFSARLLREAGFGEMLRLIREVEPDKPSMKLSSAAELPVIAATRNLEPRSLQKLITGELDWIVMKCLEKERGRRYETANGVAADLDRYLADEPVLAGPPSASYRLRKFIDRHRTAAVAAALLLLSLMAGIVGTTWGMIRANAARQAEAERAEGERLAKESAEKRLMQIQKGSDILNGVFENLDPRTEEKEGRPLRALLGDRLVNAAEVLDGEAVGDPILVARMQNRLAQSLLNLGLAEPAIRLLEKTRRTMTSQLGHDDPDTLECMNNLALGLKYNGQLDQAQRLHEETLALRKARLGADHPDTLTSMNNLAAMFRESGRVKQAIPLHEQVLALRKAKLGPDHIDTLVSMNNLGLSYHVAGMNELAVPLFEQTLALRTAKLGREHRSTVTSMNNLALGYKALGRLEDGLRLQEEAYRLRVATLGRDHPDTLISMNNLSLTLHVVGKTGQAAELSEECYRLSKARLGPDHPDTLTAMNSFAARLQNSGQLDRALPLLEESLALRRSKYGPEDQRTVTAMLAFAYALRSAGRHDRAIPMFEDAVKARRGKLGDDHPDTLLAIANLAYANFDVGKTDLALTLLQEAAVATERRQFRTEDAANLIRLFTGYAEKANRWDLGETWRRKWLAVVKTKNGPESAEYASNLSALGQNLVRQGRFEDAESVLRECVALRHRIQPGKWPVFHTQSRLGGALLGQRKFGEAEPLLVGAMTALLQAEKEPSPPDPVDMAESLERMVQLFEAQSKADEATRWRAELTNRQAAAKPGRK